MTIYDYDACLHEAGHALVAHLLGFTVTKATVATAGSILGLGGYCKYEYPAFPHSEPVFSYRPPRHTSHRYQVSNHNVRMSSHNADVRDYNARLAVHNDAIRKLQTLEKVVTMSGLAANMLVSPEKVEAHKQAAAHDIRSLPLADAGAGLDQALALLSNNRVTQLENIARYLQEHGEFTDIRDALTSARGVSYPVV